MLNVDVEGSDRVARHLRAAGAATGDLRPVWNRLEGRLSDIWQQQFESDGGLTGGWPPLEESTRRAKQRRGVQTSLLRREGTLMQGVVNPFAQAAGAVRRMTKTSYERGTSLDYAATHQFGDESRNIPQREFLVWRREDADWLVDRVGEHVTEAFQ